MLRTFRSVEGWLFVFALLPAILWARGEISQQQGRAIPGAIVAAYARETHLEMLVGQYDPHSQKWLPGTYAFTPPGIHAPFTLYGPDGKIDTIHLTQEYLTQRDERPWDWTVSISTWNRTTTRLALAVSGERPDLPRKPEIVTPVDPRLTQAVSDYLKTQKLDVPLPVLTQVVRVDLDGDGTPETIVCANSDNSTLTDQAPAAIYALSLLMTDISGKAVTIPLRVQSSYKPTHRSLDEQERLHGRLAFLQVLAVSAIAGDREEISIVNDNRHEGPEIDVYTYAHGHVSHPISTRKLYL